ncbi:hypothetical protein [Diaphorobacter caeni]|nr:hypothetical protein [Diaphorobacter caeni]MBF5005731.1 hypothetical protein [Diaphorobacter caeni]
MYRKQKLRQTAGGTLPTLRRQTYPHFNRLPSTKLDVNHFREKRLV